MPIPTSVGQNNLVTILPLVFQITARRAEATPYVRRVPESVARSRRGGFRLPPVRVLLTGILFGAVVGCLSGFFVAGAAFTFLGGAFGMIVGAAIGLVASTVALLATAVYRLTIGRTRRGIIVTSALATSLTTVAVFVTFLIEPPPRHVRLVGDSLRRCGVCGHGTSGASARHPNGDGAPASSITTQCTRTR
jgi:hypothetical protein